MRTLIYTIMALFLFTAVPLDALADRGHRHEREVIKYRNHSDSGRYVKKVIYTRDHRHHHKQHRRVERWRPAPRYRYVTLPDYRTYNVPAGYIYTSTPGISLYFSW